MRLVAARRLTRCISTPVLIIPMPMRAKTVNRAQPKPSQEATAQKVKASMRNMGKIVRINGTSVTLPAWLVVEPPVVVRLLA